MNPPGHHAAADVFPNVIEAAGNMVRGCLTAPPGRKLVVADLANIEGRVAAWLAGEDWKLQAFRDFDAGTGADLYKLSYARSFGVEPASVTKDQRQIGKVQELMLGYQGGVGAYVTGAQTYGIDLTAMADGAWDQLPPGVLAQAQDLLAWHRSRDRDPPADFKMTDKVWLVCFVLGWRAQHPAIVGYWDYLRDMAIAAVKMPGTTFDCGMLKVRCDGAWLRIRKPSGRYLVYPQPRIDDGEITYMGMNQYTRRWERLKTYGGKLFENVCQSVACDQLKDAIPIAQAAGYDTVLTVHDELVTEADVDATVDGLCAALTAPNGWNDGLPLAAAGFEGLRDRKD